MFSFENLTAFTKAREIVCKVYDLTRSFPAEEKFGLCSQLQRAVISVPSNIAEGSGRCSLKEKIHFIEIAYGSLMEAYCQLVLAVDLNYIEEKDLSELRDLFFDEARILSGLKNKFSEYLNP